MAPSRPGAEVVTVQRRRWVGGRRLAILTNLLPADIAPCPTQLSARGLYACWKALGVVPVAARQTIGARVAGRPDSERLGVREGSPLLTMERVSFDADGRVLECGSHVYDAGLHTFDMTLFAD